MIRIGITGGIGSGKSVVSEIFTLLGIPVYISDKESKELTDSSPAIRSALEKLTGEKLYKSGKLDRKKLASIIFNDNETLRKVNQIIHPAVAEHFISWSEKQQGNVCGIESAILFESGFDRLTDITITVYAPERLRIERAVVRDGATADEIKRRISNQAPDEHKAERSQYVIINDGKHSLIRQILNILSEITKHA
jgi:dephospho-CoA kinase